MNAIHPKTQVYGFTDWCAKFLPKELSMKDMKKIIWTDPQCILFWLTSKKPLSIFVKNSITKITKEKNLEFRNINTKENPADLPSRGINSTELRNWSKWLEEYSTCWPTWNEQRIDQEAIKQIQSKETGQRIPYEVTMVTESQEETHTTPPGKVKERFSFLSFLTMFYHKAKKITTLERGISAEEIEGARMR